MNLQVLIVGPKWGGCGGVDGGGRGEGAQMAGLVTVS